jgi:vitamin B12 transporter
MKYSYLFIVWMSLSFLFTLITNGEIFAQSLADTVIQLKDVEVSATRIQYFSNDVKTEVFNKDQLHDYAGESVIRMLYSSSAINIKAYGVGGALSNISLRGTSTNHVQVNWNGFPINSVTAGSCDFSMVPASGFNQVSVVYGASGTLYGSGTFGGAINLDNKLTLEKNLHVFTHAGYQSLKTADGSVSVAASNKNAAFQVNAWGAKSKNEFGYYDYIKQSDRTQTDGDWFDYGVILNTSLKLTNSSSLDLGFWRQVKSYDVPSQIGSTTYATQNDSTTKVYAGYKLSQKRWGLQVKGAMFYDFQHYLKKISPTATTYSINSELKAHQWYGDVNYRYFLKKGLSIDAGVTGAYVIADVSAYGKNKIENELASFIGVKYDYRRFLLQSSMRKEWSKDNSSKLLFAIGLSYLVIPDKWLIRANWSQKFRKPTFNDRYWNPGGNINLKPEEGYSAEIGSYFIIWKDGSSSVSADLNFYVTNVNDMIVWRPNGADWMAKNYQQVRSIGTEPSIKFDYNKEHLKIHSSLKSTINQSRYNTDEDKNKEMIYSPMLITSWENRLSYRIVDLGAWYHFTSSRYYEDDSDELLEYYQTIDLQAGVIIPATNGKIGLHVSVNNIFNTTYELVRLYPMPGRYWSANLSYTF